MRNIGFNNTYFNIDDNFRTISDSSMNKLSIQRLFNFGPVSTNSWATIADFY